MECPVCKTISDCVCDNSCGTYECEKVGCGCEFYRENTIIKIGHHPSCDVDSDVDIPDDI